jgi:DNA-binding beta-propeller fold protein YncE
MRRLVIDPSMIVVRGTVVLVLMVLCGACGQTYRPVATPVTPPPPNPGFAHFALAITGNGLTHPGASTSIDVSGDTAVSRSTVGLMPVHATFALGGTQVFVANSADGSVSEFSPSTAAPVITISLPSGMKAPVPVFVNTTQNDFLWVADAANNQVDAIALANDVVAYMVGVGSNPVSLAETPDGQKLYVANAGNGSGGSVSSINPSDRSLNTVTTTVAWVSPVSVVSRSDSQIAFVLDEGSGMVAAIDTASDTVVATASVGVGANFMTYDNSRNRLYVSNPAASNVTILDAASAGLTTIAVVPVTNPVSIAALPDGSRAYVSSATVSGSDVTSQVTVINAADGSIRSTIGLGAATSACAASPSRLSIAASADSSRVYVGNCDAGNVAVIATLSDTVVLPIPAPQSSVLGSNGMPLPQTPVFVVAGP